jgi:ATP/maltotriose-dependent transcriptional regulator MalT
LTRLLDETAAPVIILVAPAGYGKTTLAQQWLGQRSHGWYRATSSSSDVAAFSLGVAKAVDPVIPGAGRAVAEVLAGIAQPDQQPLTLADALVASIGEWPQEAWLGIDDYHLAAYSNAVDVFATRLIESLDMNLLVTSRHRPAWVSARKLLYGHVFEIGQARLAMTDDEALCVLGEESGSVAGGLVSLANGWPAVIGLAAAAGASVPNDDPVAETLERYFAEELFNRANPALRTPLTVLALAPTLTRDAISSLVNADVVDGFIDASVELGFFMSRADDFFEMNPLVRRFLRAKLVESAPDEVERGVRLVLDRYLRRRLWDDAYSLIEAAEKYDAIPRLVRRSIEDALRDGRLSTLANWCGTAYDQGVSDPILHLAEAEVAFRRGLNIRAEALATEAAHVLPVQDRFHARACLRAGQAAYFNERHEVSLRHFECAQRSTRDPKIAREALWGSFVTAADIEGVDAKAYLDAYEQLPERTVDDAVRLTSGRLALAHYRGGLADILGEARERGHLADRAVDPMVRTAFWHSFSLALALSAQYRAALEAADNARRHGAESGLAFVDPHSKLIIAQALLGMGQNMKGARLLEEIEADAATRDDDFIAVNARTLLARLYLARRKPAAAIEATESLANRSESSATRAERLAVRALALFATGDLPRATKSARSAITTISTCVARDLAQLILALAEGPQAKDKALESIQRAAADGCLDVLVLAYRAKPSIAELILDALGEVSFVTMLREAHDERLGGKLGLFPPRQDELVSKLSRREREVSLLLAEGRTNADIAQKLFISEMTVKVHVRNIFSKVGARNRAEAAVLLATRLDA